VNGILGLFREANQYAAGKKASKMNIWSQWLFAVVFLLAGGRSAAG